MVDFVILLCISENPIDDRYRLDIQLVKKSPTKQVFHLICQYSRHRKYHFNIIMQLLIVHSTTIMSIKY